MVHLRIGRLLPGYREVGFGSCSPVRGISLFAEGECAVIAKKIPDREIAVEVICSCIGREFGLPIPEPVLLLNSDNNWFFGSVDIGHPNLMQVATASDAAIIGKLEKWPPLIQAACFDEWIANPDRGNENLLFDGSGFFLIDHGMAIPSGMPADDWSDDYYNNQLLEIVTGSCERADDLRLKKAKEAQGWSSTIEKFDTAYDFSALPSVIDDSLKLKISKFLRERVIKLGDELYRKLNPHQGALNFHD
ncbi:hypothetical protein CIG19_21175 [Enterobacterales bacterium CwR94]|nr:hypothetical protein CIG19_21175 [Enterobacterales bacterium CwR94]